MTQGHTLKAYDAELNELRAIISQMGGMAEAQIAAAVEALVNRDVDRANAIILADQDLDALEEDAEKLAIQTIALRAPMADDLRRIVSVLKISAVLERVGDYAKNIAKRTTVLAQSELSAPVAILPAMARAAVAMLTDVLDAYATDDVEKAVAVRERDTAVDDLYNALFRELLTYMVENPRTITQVTHLLFIAKNIERVGDHATNIAEIVHYSVTGERLSDERAKQDDTAFVVAPPPDAGARAQDDD